MYRSMFLFAVILASTTAAAEPEPLDLTGRWQIGSSVLILKHDGKRVTGTYRNGQSSMEGTLKDHTWSGSFRYDASVHGTMSYKFSKDGMTFEGHWANATDSKKGPDKGKRLLDATGRWKLGSRTLILKQDGNRITGTYRNGSSSMDGKLDGNTWTGTFKYDSSVHGTFTYTFNPTFTRFEGPWANATDSKKGIGKAKRLE